MVKIYLFFKNLHNFFIRKCFNLHLFSANNLYGSMETLKLPVSNFTWVSQKELQRMSTDVIMNLSAQDDIGYAFEVDMQYPNHLHKVIPFCNIFYNNIIK